MSRDTMSGHVTLFLVVLAALLLPATAAGHAYLERSEPAANAVLPVPPAEVRIWFTEPLERAYTNAALYDATGALVTTPDAVVGEDPYQLSLELPADLPDGAYTVQWANISTVDGHPAEGFFSFTVGEASDVPPDIVTPELSADDGPGLLGSIGRWLGLLGIAGAVGSLFCWYWVMRPSVQPLPDDAQVATARTVRWLASAGAALSGVGVTLLLLDRIHDATGSVSFGTAVDFIRDSQTGTTLALRIGLVLIFGAMLASRFPWSVGGRSVDGLLAQAVGALVLFQFAQLTHATAQEPGEPAAVVAQWLHLAAAGVWIGGVFALSVALLRTGRRVTGVARRELLAVAIARFSTLAISAVVIVSLSGLYAGWLHIGSLDALRDSDYGRTLLIKLTLAVPIIALGALNLFVLGPALCRAAPRERAFGRTVTAEAALGAAVLFLAAILASTPPPQPVQAAEPGGGAELHLFAPGGHTILSITPGQVGHNQYIANVVPDEGGLPLGSELLLRIERDDQISGIRELRLEPSVPLDGVRDAARFEAAGSELSVVGAWELEVILRRPGLADWRAGSPLEIGAEAPAATAVDDARGFTGWYAAPLMLLAAACIVAVVVILRRDRTPAAVVAEGRPDPAD